MLTESNLQELIAYKPGSSVLSVYLNIDPSSGTVDTHKLVLRQLIKPYQEQAPDDVARIERFIEYEHDWHSRSLILFSCSSDSFFQPIAIAVPVRSRARLLQRPYVKPLAQLLDQYGNYGVALVDMQGARLFYFHLGTLREQEGTLGESIRTAKDGGGSQSSGRRGGGSEQGSVDETADRNLRDAASFAASFFSENQVRRVLIGGTDKNAARFQEYLPKVWQSLVAGTFAMPMTATYPQVQEKALEIVSKVDQAEEARLVKQVITAAAKGQGGVIRLDDTLGAVHAGQVQTLCVDEGFRAPGYRCTGCGYITSQEIKSCGFCGGSYEKIEDAVEMAVRNVIRDGGEVEFIHNSEELVEVGRIGGILRY
ncbi:MAG: hypothetical protein JXA25_05225 [Anaerolineales bacterium]|nr:hypothetical protein [Anaerolineales bacterium]